jgi:hypothetical protein
VNLPFQLAGPLPRRDQDHPFAEGRRQHRLVAHIFAHALQPVGQFRAAQPGLKGPLIFLRLLMISSATFFCSGVICCGDKAGKRSAAALGEIRADDAITGDIRHSKARTNFFMAFPPIVWRFLSRGGKPGQLRLAQAFLAKTGRDGGKFGGEVGADGAERGDDDDRDQGRDQAIFNGRGSRFIAQKAGERPGHDRKLALQPLHIPKNCNGSRMLPASWCGLERKKAPPTLSRVRPTKAPLELSLGSAHGARSRSPNAMSA